jgi:FAD:protein FMN transferase
VATISSATRQPGQYRAVWDGNDDHQKPVKPGTYTVYLEAVREHGTYQLMRKEVTIGTQPFREEFTGNMEVKTASLEYRQRSAAK